ncbi:MAG: prolyl-tRNA editing enzyme YbaK/EbsC (Cys-tRNA(Pro) deacylase) [Candidatus Nanohaloarchaea archaeon]|jgi:prolyl-tRNA editing enzyme YbaK/EbsC (Cys-tRNA(Pro) deacylase)
MKAFKQTRAEMSEFADFIESDIENVQRVLEAVEEADIEVEFMVHAKSETVKESAENTDVNEAEIVKTLIFIADKPVAVLCSGDKRVSEDKLEKITDSEVRMAKPDEVKDKTGYIIGGVSPFDLDIKTFIEEDLMDREEVKPAAGSRVVGVTLDPEDLKEVAGAETADVAE